MPDPRLDVSALIRQARNRLGMTQEDAATGAGFGSQSMWSQWESSRAERKFRQLRAFAAVGGLVLTIQPASGIYTDAGYLVDRICTRIQDIGIPAKDIPSVMLDAGYPSATFGQRAWRVFRSAGALRALEKLSVVLRVVGLELAFVD